MTMTLEETVESRRTVTDKYQRLESVTLLYALSGTADDVAAKQFVKDETPERYPDVGDDPGSQQILQSLPRGPIDLDPEWVDTETADGLWHVTVRYRWPDRVAPPPEDEIVTTFDTTGGTKRMTHAIKHVKTYPAGAEEHNGLIGWDGERLQGCDIIVSACTFSETHHRYDALMTPGYKRQVAKLSGTVNNGPFRDFELGEVLFVGVTGSKRGDEKWELTYRFSVSVNETDLKFGKPNTAGEIIGVEKEGWQYLWIGWHLTPKPGELVPEPKAVHVEQVYYLKDFALLDID